MKSLETKCEEIAEEIAKTFENRSYVLNFIHRSHFMVRLYRTTNNDMFLNPVIERFLIEKEEIMKDFDNLNKKRYIEKRSDELFDYLEKKHDIKHLKRAELFRRRKEFLFYYHIMQHLYFWRVFDLNKGKMRKHYSNGIKFLKKFLKDDDFEHFFFDTDMIKYFGTQLVNCVYYMKHLGLVDITKKFNKRYKEVFDDRKDKELSDYLYKNKIYGLTHFVIAGTNYYQRYSSKREFGWILSYFKKNIRTIIKRTNPDICCEVGLCFKLCKVNAKKELDLLRKHIIRKFSKKLGYIPRGKKTMDSSEHTAAVSYLFLSNFKKLYKGPNIREEVDKRI